MQVVEAGPLGMASATLVVAQVVAVTGLTTILIFQLLVPMDLVEEAEDLGSQAITRRTDALAVLV
jgi:hypothetical protein